MDTLMLAVDVKDAVLSVCQEQPTRVRCTNAAGITMSYMLGRVLPGQRDGSLLWHKALVRFLAESSLNMTENKGLSIHASFCQGCLHHIDPHR